MENNYIEITQTKLQSLFNELNKLCFNNELPKVNIKIVKTKKFTGVFEYSIHGQYINGKYERTSINHVIKISTLFHFTEEKLRNVMCHEMIHYFMALNYPGEKVGHSYKFTQMMDRLNKEHNMNMSVYDEDPTELNTDNIKEDLTEYVLFTADYNGMKALCLIHFKSDSLIQDNLAEKTFKRYGCTNLKKYYTSSPLTKVFKKSKTFRGFTYFKKDYKFYTDLMNDSKTKLSKVIIESLNKEPNVEYTQTKVSDNYIKIIAKNLNSVNQILVGKISVFTFRNFIYIENIKIQPFYRKQGYFKILMQKVEELAKSLNYNEIRLDAFPLDDNINQKELIKIYQSLGYVLLDNENKMRKRF